MKYILITLLFISLSYGQKKPRIEYGAKSKDFIIYADTSGSRLIWNNEIILLARVSYLDSLKRSNAELKHKNSVYLKIAYEAQKENEKLRILNQNNISAIIEQAGEIKRLQLTIDSLKVK